MATLPTVASEKKSLLRPPPSRWTWSTPIVVVVLALFTAYCVWDHNWLGATIDAAIVLVNVMVGVHRWVSMDRLWQQYRRLKVMETIVNTPVMREEGNSIIFTFLCPTDRLLVELNLKGEESGHK